MKRLRRMATTVKRVAVASVAIKRLLLAGALFTAGIGVSIIGVALVYPPAAIVLLGAAIAAVGFDIGRP